MSGESLTFAVPFVAGKKRHRLDRRHARMYTPTENIRQEEAVGAAARAAIEEAFPGTSGVLFGPHVPVNVRIDVTVPLPKSKPKRVRSEPNTHIPDADNIAKLVLDGMNGVVYADDAQVVGLNVMKWPRRRGVENEMLVSVVRGWEPSRGNNETEE